MSIRATSVLFLLVHLVPVGLGCAVSATGGPGNLGVSGKADIADLSSDAAPDPRVELKVTILPVDIELALDVLALDRDDSERRFISFYDTPTLDLFEAGLVLRSRKVIDDADDSTVKLRPFTTEEAWAQIPELFEDDGFKCEIDRSPSSEVSSCSLGAEQDRGEIDDVAAGERDIDKLFSRAQEDLVALYGPQDLDWNALVVLGPVDTERWKTSQEGLAPELTVELWQMPDGGQLLELSIKVDGDESEEAMASLLAFVEGHSLRLDTAQTTKTRRVMSFFADSE